MNFHSFSLQMVPWRDYSLASHPLTDYYAVTPNGHSLPGSNPRMNIGETIRNFRLQKGMSQGDIEKRTGLLRCYLSRVENGHTVPSLDTLSRIATAMDLPLSRFFADGANDNGGRSTPQLAEDEVRFLTQIRRYSPNLNDSDRKLVIAMVKKMAATAGK
jgi:transcriptional regulator with XRE-family HTH domain